MDGLMDGWMMGANTLCLRQESMNPKTIDPKNNYTDFAGLGINRRQSQIKIVER